MCYIPVAERETNIRHRMGEAALMAVIAIWLLVISDYTHAEWTVDAPTYNAPEYVKIVPQSAMAYECEGYVDWLGCAYRLPDSFLIVIVAGLQPWLHACVLKHERRHKHESHPIDERKDLFTFCEE